MTLSTLNKLTAAALFLTTAVLVASAAANCLSHYRGTGRDRVAFRASDWFDTMTP